MDAGEHHNCARRGTCREYSISLENQLVCTNAAKKQIVLYSWKYSWGIKFGRIAVLEANCQIKIRQYNYSPLIAFSTWTELPFQLKKWACYGDLPQYMTDHNGIHHHLNSVCICTVLRFPFASECSPMVRVQKCLEMWCPLSQLSIKYISMVCENARMVLFDRWVMVSEWWSCSLCNCQIKNV